MKNRKSSITAFVSAVGLACILLLGGCSQDDAPTPGGGTKEDGNAIRFTSTISHFMGADTPGTRAAIDLADGTGSFENGDEIAIVVFDLTAQSVKDHPATYRNGAWATDMTWDEFDEGTMVAFFAFFPKLSLNEFNEEGFYTISLPTVQSAPAQYAAADWLHASTGVTVAESNQPVELRFHHIMHRLTVNLSLSATPGTLTQADVDAATVVIKNMCTTGKATATGGLLYSNPDTAPTGDFTPLKSGTGNTFHVILLPQNVTPGTPWIEITVAGKTVTYSIPDGLTALLDGMGQVVNLKLTSSGATDGGITTAEALLAALKTGGTSDNPTKITLGGDITMPKGPNEWWIGTPMTGGGYYKIDGGGHTLSWVTESGYYLGNNQADADATYIEITNTKLAYEDSNLAVACIYNGKITLGEGVTVDGRYNMILASGVKATLELGDGCVLPSSDRYLASAIYGATLVLNGGATAAGAYIRLQNEGPNLPTPVVSIPKALTKDVSLILGFHMNTPEILIAEGTSGYQLTEADINHLIPHPTESAVRPTGEDWLEFEGNLELYLDAGKNQIKLRKKAAL